MKLIYFAVFAFAIFSACNAEPTGQSTDTADDPAMVAVDTMAAPAASADPVNEWADFWTTFKVAVRDREARDVARMTVFPLRGSEAWDEEGSSSLGRGHMYEHFDEIFDAKVQEKFAKADDRDFMTLKAVNQEHAKLLNVPIGTEVKALHVVYIFDAGTPEQTESSLIFNFAKVDGVYKFVSLMQAG